MSSFLKVSTDFVVLRINITYYNSELYYLSVRICVTGCTQFSVHFLTLSPDRYGKYTRLELESNS